MKKALKRFSVLFMLAFVFAISFSLGNNSASAATITPNSVTPPPPGSSVSATVTMRYGDTVKVSPDAYFYKGELMFYDFFTYSDSTYHVAVRPVDQSTQGYIGTWGYAYPKGGPEASEWVTAPHDGWYYLTAICNGDGTKTQCDGYGSIHN